MSVPDDEVYRTMLPDTLFIKANGATTLTDDWIACFEEAKTAGNLSRIFFRLALHTLPEGVDGDDPRVVDAIKELRSLEGKIQ